MLVFTETQYLIYISTLLQILYFIPQFYTIYQSKSFNYFDLPPQVILLIVFALMCKYSIIIEDDELLIMNCIMLVLNFLEFLFMGYYAYFNGFNAIPHEKFQEQIRRNQSRLNSNDLTISKMEDKIEILMEFMNKYLPHLEKQYQPLGNDENYGLIGDDYPKISENNV